MEDYECSLATSMMNSQRSNKYSKEEKLPLVGKQAHQLKSISLV